MTISSRPSRGTHDYSIPETRHREDVVDAVRRVYRRHGFRGLQLPALEPLEVLSAKYDQGDHLIYRIESEGDSKGLRYDHTVPLARHLAARRQDYPKTAHVYQIGPVWRGERPGLLRYREFVQCDVDILGAHDPSHDLDLLCVMVDVLREVGVVKHCEVRLNHRAVVDRTLRQAGVPEDMIGSVCVALDKWHKIGADAVAGEMVVRGLEEAVAQELVSSIEHLTEVPPELEDLFATVKGEVETLYDPTLVRGLDYYDGMLFEFDVGGLSIAGGGRYSSLAPLFHRGVKEPCVGGSFGLERLMSAVGPHQAHKVCQVGVMTDLRSWANLLRRQTEVVARSMELGIVTLPGTRQEAMKAADKMGLDHILFVQDGAVVVRDLLTGDQGQVCGSTRPPTKVPPSLRGHLLHGYSERRSRAMKS